MRLRNEDPRPTGFDFDPPAFEFVDHVQTFDVACRYAQSCATEWDCVAMIVSDGYGRWAVWADSRVDALKEHVDVDPYDADEESDDEYRERVAQEEEDRIRDDIDDERRSYQDGFVRSNEDGWYYSDDD